MTREENEKALRAWLKKQEREQQAKDKAEADKRATDIRRGVA